MQRIFQKISPGVLAGILLILALAISPALAEVDFQIYFSPSGAVVSVDNFWFDTTPATVKYVGSGWHTIQVSMDGYQTNTQSQYCDDNSGGTQVCVINVDLAPNPVSVGWLDINPSGAEVWVDGIDQGNGRMQIPLSPGNHLLVLKKPGFYDYSETFSVGAGQTASRAPGMTPYPEQPRYGSLQIDSDPAGAAVYLDNAYKGVEPAWGAFYITDLLPGTYTLTLNMQDYQPWTQKVVVQAGIVNDIHAKLVANPVGPTPDTTGQIYFYSVPATANIYVDNAYRGITPLTLRDIPAGNHAVIYKLAGYQDYSTIVTVTGGTIVNVPATLASSGPVPNPPTPSPAPTKSPTGPVPVILGLGLTGAVILMRKDA
jgi:hypothetical protein